MRITIGMPCYDDWDGVFFSLEGIRMFHPEILGCAELLVVDANPKSRLGELTRKFAESAKIRYVPIANVGSAHSKDQVFKEATGEYVICMDCHVLVQSRAFRRLVDLVIAKPELKSDLIQGPLLTNDRKIVRTHFKPQWRGDMYGTWDTDDRGYGNELFEIPMQGMGIFACGREQWLGFSEHFAGFGGEEFYIHEKYRQAGRRVWCAPWFRWTHRFGRAGVPYRLKTVDKVKNYLVAWSEIGRAWDDVIEVFLPKVGQAGIDEAVAYAYSVGCFPGEMK